MKFIIIALICVLLVASVGCTYGRYYTFANSRKLMESNAPNVTKVCFVVFVLIAETLWSPVTVYIDSGDYMEDKDHVYLSYIGMQTLLGSDMPVFYKVMGSILTAPIDTVWFPVAGTIDTFYALSRDESGGSEDDEGSEDRW